MKSKIILSILVASVFFACNKDKKAMKQIDKNIVEGTWRISSFIDSGDDETYEYSNYTFTFSDNGTVNATNGSSTISGSWNTSNSSSNDDSSSDLHFNLNFSVDDSHPFDDLIDDWDVTSQSESKLELKDVSGGNGGTDILIFVKN